MHNVLDKPKKKLAKYAIAVFLDILGAFDCLWWVQLVKDMRSAN